MMARRSTKSGALMRAGKWCAGISVVILFSLIAGFQHFVLTLPKTPPDAPARADGIVVITGGQQRLATGFALLQAGRSTKMLVSGVGNGVNKAILARELGLDHHGTSLFDCCVELEFQAGDTRGNAVAAQSWSARNQIRSVLLVTANYHMPRAAQIFTRQMPDIGFIFWPVSPDDLTLQNWWYQPSILRLLGREYAKYLAESIRRPG
ncbi:MAG: YdcF family protein [Alphaproteobacteria bacterium]|jgi:uncharacterized SAM-binding protein YcdF (DUF218 family)|nr:YdcF family protein [Alphaproteobacteria bacterium]